VKIRRFGAMIGVWLVTLVASDAGWGRTASPTAGTPRHSLSAEALPTCSAHRHQNMAAQWNGSIILEIQIGANGSIAARMSRARHPTAYMAVGHDILTTSPSLNIVLRWDPVRDSSPSGRFVRRQFLHRSDVLR